MPQYTNISIRINQKQEQGYPVELTYDLQTFTGTLAEDILEAGPSKQGIFNSIFKSEKLLEAWNRVKDRQNKCIRLHIDENANELHTVPWELMCEGNLANIPFSRYIPSENPWPSETLERPLKVLVIISNPHDLEQKYNNLPPIDLEKEKRLLEEAVESLPAVQLEFMDEPVTLERVNDCLRNNEYHIIHYIGHAAFNKDKEQAVLYFQDAYGNTKRILSDEFFTVLNHQSHKPRLVFLSACNTGEHSNTTGFRNLGIELVKAGIPAVVAMQNSISMESSREFNRVFYQQLLTNDGIVNKAVSVARNALRTAKRTDVSAPILFARLQDSALFTDKPILPHSEFEKSFIGRENELDRLKQGLTNYPLAVIEGISGIGKSWLAERLAYEMLFDKQSIIEISLTSDMSAITVWTDLGKRLKDLGFPGIAKSLEGGQATDKGNWVERRNQLESTLKQQRLLIIFDNFHNITIKEDTEGWKALLRPIIKKELQPIGSSRFILLSQEKAMGSLRDLGFESEKNYFHLYLEGLHKKDIPLQAQKLYLTLSEEDLEAVDALYKRTLGHPMLICQSLDYMSTRSYEEQREFLNQMPERVDNSAPADPIVRYIVDITEKQLTEEQREALEVLSLARTAMPKDIFQIAFDRSNSDLILQGLQNRYWVEVRVSNHYYVHKLISQFMREEFALGTPALFRTTHSKLAEAYQRRQNLSETLYHYTEIGQMDNVEALLKQLNVDVLSISDLDLVVRSMDKLWQQISTENSYALQIQAGQASERLGGYEKAFDWYKRAYKAAITDSEKLKSMIYQAWAEHRLGHSEAVDKIWHSIEKRLSTIEGVETKPYARCHIIRSHILAERYQPSEAQERFDLAFKVLNIDPPTDAYEFQDMIEEEELKDLLPLLARVYRALGWAWVNWDSAKAEECLEHARTLYEKTDNEWLIALMDNNIGWNYMTWGKYKEAQAAFDSARSKATRLGDEFFIIPLVLTNEAIMYLVEGTHWRKAGQNLHQAWKLMEAGGYTPNIPNVLEALGGVLSKMGEWGQAKAVLEEQIKLSKELQNKAQLSWGRGALAELALLKVEAGFAVGSATAAIQNLNTLGLTIEEDDPYDIAHHGSLRALYMLLTGNADNATQHIEPAIKVYEDQGKTEAVTEGWLYEIKGRILAQNPAQSTAARIAFERSIEVQRDRFYKAHACYHYAKALQTWNGDSSDSVEVQEQMQNALKILETLPAAWLAYQAWESITGNEHYVVLEPTIYKRLWIALLKYGPFINDNWAEELFTDDRLSPWRDTLPSTSTPSDRLVKTIAHLSNKFHPETQENALVLLLRVIHDTMLTDPQYNDVLVKLGNDLVQTLKA